MRSSGEVGESLPLTSAQREVWFAQQLLGEVPLTTTQYIDVAGPLDRDTYQEAARRAARELGAYLRFDVEFDGQVRQWIDYDQDDEIGYLDLRAEPDPEAAAHAWMRADQCAPFDLRNDPPLRTTILHIAPDRHFIYGRAHHIALDGYGAMRLQQRHAELYAAMTRGEQPPAGPEHSPADLVDADIAYLHSTRHDTDRRYWTDKVDGLPDPVTLATRPGPPAAQAIVVGGPLESRLHAALERAAGDTGTAAVLVAALAGYLARMTGAPEVTLSLPVTARTTALLRRAAGMVTNVVPLRVRTGPATSIAELLAAARGELSGALRHQRFRGEEVARIAQRGPDAGGFGPAVNIMNFRAGVDLGAATGTLHLLSTGPVADLAVNIYPADSGVRMEWEANPNRYTQAELIAQHRRFLDFLGEFVTAPASAAVHALEVLRPEEREQLVPWQGPEAVPAVPLAELIAAAVARNPQGTAVVHGDRRWTYAEFDAWTDRLARALIAAGAGPETLVAMVLERSAESVAAVWAISKAGAAFVPIDPGYPAERIAHILGDSAARLGVSTAALQEGLPDTTTWLLLDDPATTAGFEAGPVTDAERRARLDPAHPAYLIYTSGSTGTPKGVLVTHGGLANLAAERRDRYDLHPGARTLHHASPGFDMAVGEQLCALAGAATLVVAPRYVVAGADLAELMRREAVTNAIITPAVLATLDPAQLPSLRVLGVGGEAIRADLVEAWAPGRLMRNGYGPTEATDIATIGELVAGRPVTIGAPLRGFRAVVLDALLRPVPPGTPGELYIGGPALARGYHGKPGLTATRFVADPYGRGDRLYRTGDLVTITAGPDPALIYHGRTDFQIKVRGHRIEPGEIETVLTARAEIARAAVTVHTDERTGAHLVAYLVPANGASIDLDALRNDLAEALPAYLRPAAYTVLDALPLTANGKLDTRRLPAPVFGRTGFRAPATPAERRVAAIFAEVLGLESVGATADFFALGGTSLTATQVAARLGTGVRTIFDAPTVASLAARLDTRSDDAPGLAPRPRPDRIPPAPAQLRLWLLNQLMPESSAYHLPVALGLTGPLDPVVLAAAVTAVLDRHEVLRTVYPETSTGPYQRILATARAAELIDLAPIDVERTDLDQQLSDLAAAPFDLTRDLPVRVRLLRLGAEEHVLALVAHHIAADGWSFGPLIADLTTAYAAHAAGTGPAWSPLPVQYADYALWQQDRLGERTDADSIAARQLAYWTHTLAGAPAYLPLPADRAGASEGPGATVDIELPAADSALAELARRHDATVFMVTYAAYLAVLHELCGSTDLTVGTPVAGRGHPALDPLVGMFVNTLPVRVAVEPGEPFTALLARVREAALAAFDNADVPFHHIVDAVNPPRAEGRSPLFQTVFSFENLPTLPALELDGLRVEVLDLPRASTHFELALTVRQVPGREGLAAEFRYATERYDRSTVAGIALRFQDMVARIIGDPACAIGGTESRGAEHGQAGASDQRMVAGQPPTLGDSVARPAAVREQAGAAGTSGDKPSTDREIAVAAVFAEVLGTDEITLDDTFFDLGGTSLLVFTLRTRLAERLGLDVDPRTVFEQPTVRALAALEPAADRDDRWVAELTADTRLDPAIDIAGLVPPVDTGDVLLTGATGFLGVHLLRELLDRTDSRIWCLVRGRDHADGLRRITAALARYQLPHHDLAERVVPVPGDLEQPRLGLSEADFADLAARISVIHHNGARVNHLESYADLRAANVGGTTEVLRLATTVRIKPVHFVSTLNAVLGTETSGVVLEDSDIPAAEVTRHGYVAAKWVAEQLVLAAGERGVPVAVYRPGLITGSVETGVMSAGDSMWTMVRAAALLGVAPDLGDTAVSLAPVDYVARALVAIANTGLPDSGRYHLVNTTPTRVADILDGLVRMGFRIDTVDLDEAKRRLAEQAVDHDDLMRATLLIGNYADLGDSGVADVILDDSCARRALEPAGISCPAITSEVIDRYLAAFRADGVLPEPQQVEQASS
ncbi:amino acid adenylation domain-containing protein [Nocardia cyriacigeorgica]|uniref:Amino acid adenylation domain-containing protein n=1 Tax=Nocardia cyriacigeorgica TaxID=135487 RepID=A0A5R8PCA9_9NOCA|nr:non-ribosomal peptide synthetase [Nocardia cyriacigeorgica]TLG08753.1 amino acid adenylation domain-containing protein [Nocardia cyriacigeorgica]